MALEGAREAADCAYWPGIGLASQIGLAAPHEIAAASVWIERDNPDRAIIAFDPRVGGRPEQMRLVRSRGKWFLGVELNNDEAVPVLPDADPQTAMLGVCVMAWGVEDSIPRIAARDIEGAENPVQFAGDRGMGYLMAGATATAHGKAPFMTEQEFRAIPEKLAQLQTQRQPSRREAAKRAPMDPMALFVPPTTAPAAPVDASTPLAAARAVCDSIVRQDATTLWSLVERDGLPATDYYAAAQIHRELAGYDLRAAVIERFGRDAVSSLPRNGSWVFFADRLTAGADGRRSKVTWIDDLQPNERPKGTPCSKLFVCNSGGKWQMATVSVNFSDHGSYNAAEVYNEANGLEFSARAASDAARRIRTGEIKSLN